jgi:hypothetical protein
MGIGNRDLANLAGEREHASRTLRSADQVVQFVNDAAGPGCASTSRQ